MTDHVTPCPDPEALLVLLYDDEGMPGERAKLQAHVDRCTACAADLAMLDTTRGALGAWHAPRLPLGFALVQQPRRSAWHAAAWRGGMAAAAVLVLASAASVARLDITYGSDGLRITTGQRATTTDVASGTSTLDAAVRPAPASAGAPLIATAASPSTMAPAPAAAAWVGTASAGDPPWRADLDMLATQLRADIGRLAQETARQPAPTLVHATGPGRGSSDAELLRRIQELIDQSEVRQQSNLALRVTELGRQFELQRQNDIVQVEQAFQRLEQQRSDLLRRVAATQPRP